MMARLPLLAAMALLALALFAPAAIAQDDDYDDDDGAVTATATATVTATATATAGADDADDDDSAVGGATALPSTGGPALVPVLAGALLLGSGVVAGVFGLRRDS